MFDYKTAYYIIYLDILGRLMRSSGFLFICLYGQKYSVIWFLFICSSGFGLMELATCALLGGKKIPGTLKFKLNIVSFPLIGIFTC